MSGYARLTALVVCAASIAAILAPSAIASSGEITRAQANSSWTEALVAGSVNWTGCLRQAPKWPDEGVIVSPEWPGPIGNEGPLFPPIVEMPPSVCEWIAFATIGPGEEVSDCKKEGRAFPTSLGSGVSLVWSGNRRSGTGSEEFDVSSPLVDEADQLVCLSVIEIATVQESGVVCPFHIVVGGPNPPCPPIVVRQFSRQLDSAVIEPTAPQGEHEPPSMPPPEEESTPLQPPQEGSPPPGSLPGSGRQSRRCAKRHGEARASHVYRCKRRGHPRQQQA